MAKSQRDKRQVAVNSQKRQNDPVAALSSQLDNQLAHIQDGSWGIPVLEDPGVAKAAPTSVSTPITSTNTTPVIPTAEEMASRYSADLQPVLDEVHGRKKRATQLSQQALDMGIGQDEIMSVGTQMLNKEKEDASAYFRNNKKARQAMSNNPNVAAMAYNSMTPEEQEEFQRMSANSNGSFATGAMDSIPLLGNISNTFEKNGVINPEYGMKAQSEKAMRDDALGYMLGKGATEIGKYAVGGEVAKSIPALAKAGSLTSRAMGLGEAGADVFTSMIGDQLVDLSLDTLPQVLNDVQDGKDRQQIIRDAVTNFGTNAVFNIIGGSAEAIFDAGKSVAKNSDDIAELVEGATKQTDEATDAIKNLSEEIPEVPKAQVELERQAMNGSEGEMDRLRQALAEQNNAPAVPQVADVAENIAKDPEITIDLDRRKSLVDKARSSEGAYKPRSKAEKYGKLNDNSMVVNDIFNNQNNVNETMNGIVRNFGDKEDAGSLWEMKDLINHYKETGDADSLAEAKAIASELDAKFAGKTIKDSDVTFEAYSESLSSIVDKLTAPRDMFSAIDPTSPIGSMARRKAEEIMGEDILKLPIEQQDEAVEEFMDMVGSLRKTKELTGEEAQQLIKDVTDKYNANRAGFGSVAENVVENAPESIDDVDRMLREMHMEDDARNAIPNVEPTTVENTVEEAIPLVENVPQDNTKGVFDTTNGTPGTMKERSYDNKTIVDKTDMPDEIKQEFIDNPDLYRVISNKETSAVADEIMATNDFEGAYSKFNELLGSRDPASVPLGYDLAKKAAEDKNYDLSVDILEKMSESLTQAGQFTQAAAIRMMGSDPMAAQRLMQREIAKINKSGVEKFGSSWKKISLDKSELEAFKNIKPGDAEAIEKLFNNITTRVAKEMPATTWEKIVEATKTAMMLNPRTHIRNVAANSVMVPVRSLSDRVSALGQNAVHLFDKDFKVTQSLVGGTKKQKDIAGKIFDERIKPLLEGNNEYKDVAKNANRGKQVFKDSKVGTGLQKATLSATSFVNNITGGRLQGLVDTLDESLTGSVMENLRKFDYFLLGAVEDDPFVKANFQNRLASYMKAQGINAIDNVPDEAVQIAYQEALKATFKDDNFLTKMFAGIKRDTGKFGEVLLPFTKTPANIAKRGMEYSPVGFVESLQKLKKEGKLTTEIVDDLAKNATGTAGIYIGYQLAKNGMINGSLSDNKREKQFQKQQGKQAFSINVGDQSFTFDWAQPAAIPLIIGATINDAIEVSDAETADALSTFDKAKQYAGIAKDAGIAAFDSWADLSPLQSFKEIFGGDGYGSGSIGENILNAITEFPQRLIPSLSGAVARTNDRTYRESYVKGDPIETWVNQAKSKIPAVGDDDNWWNQNVSSKSLPASYDGWGQERTRQDTTAGAAFANFVNPGSMSNAHQTEIDPEISRLFETTGDENVFPRTAEYTVKDADKKEITLNNEQHSELQRELGRTSYDLVSSFIKSDAYSTLDDTAKKDAITELYNAANQYVKNKLYGTEASNKIAKMLINGASPEEVANYAKMSADFDKYGLTMSEKNIASYERASRTANPEESIEKFFTSKTVETDLFKKYDVTNNEKTHKMFSDAYAKGGEQAAEEALKSYKDEKNLYHKYSLDDSSVAKRIYEERQDEELLKYYSKIAKVENNTDLIKSAQSGALSELPEEKRGYLMAQKISNPGNVAKALKESGDYTAFYRYYDIKNIADTNGNGSLSAKKTKKSENEMEIAINYMVNNYGYSAQEASLLCYYWFGDGKKQFSGEK